MFKQHEKTLFTIGTLVVIIAVGIIIYQTTNKSKLPEFAALAEKKQRRISYLIHYWQRQGRIRSIC